ncbi:uncharacterized protein V1516DRAFT_638302 [Lipomyces oligophaga]|uniref:uncharacterized protein n=1 Tax=Lipomyces oligophaga TaxID=45792 RepID=UPI0034CDF0C6
MGGRNRKPGRQKNQNKRKSKNKSGGRQVNRAQLPSAEGNNSEHVYINELNRNGLNASQMRQSGHRFNMRDEAMLTSQHQFSRYSGRKAYEFSKSANGTKNWKSLVKFVRAGTLNPENENSEIATNEYENISDIEPISPCKVEATPDLQISISSSELNLDRPKIMFEVSTATSNESQNDLFQEVRRGLDSEKDEEDEEVEEDEEDDTKEILNNHTLYNEILNEEDQLVEHVQHLNSVSVPIPSGSSLSISTMESVLNTQDQIDLNFGKTKEDHDDQDVNEVFEIKVPVTSNADSWKSQVPPKSGNMQDTIRVDITDFGGDDGDFEKDSTDSAVSLQSHDEKKSSEDNASIFNHEDMVVTDQIKEIEETEKLEELDELNEMSGIPNDQLFIADELDDTLNSMKINSELDHVTFVPRIKRLESMITLEATSQEIRIIEDNSLAIVQESLSTVHIDDEPATDNIAESNSEDEEDEEDEVYEDEDEDDVKIDYGDGIDDYVRNLLEQSVTENWERDSDEDSQSNRDFDGFDDYDYNDDVLAEESEFVTKMAKIKHQLPLSSKKKKKQDLSFEGVADLELREWLQNQWAADKERKKTYKRAREEKRRAGMLSKKARTTGQPDLAQKYKKGISLKNVRTEIENFIRHSELSTLSLPPMAKKDRKSVHILARSYELGTKSIGGGNKRFTMVFKTQKTFDETRFGSLEHEEWDNKMLGKGGGSRGEWSRLSSKGPRGSRNTSVTAGGASGSVRLRDGEFVGADAAKIGGDNYGRRMLEKMGWEDGGGLGVKGNVGRSEPIFAQMKAGRGGLG